MILSPRMEQRAIRYNSRNMSEIGWPRFYQEIAALLNIDFRPTREAFAQAIANWQSNQILISPRLATDGKLGPNTWRIMRLNLRNTNRRRPWPAWISGRTTPPLSPVDSTLSHGVAEPSALPQAGQRRSPAQPSMTEVRETPEQPQPIATSSRKPPWLLEAEVQMRLWSGVVEGETDIDGDYFDAVPYFGGKAQVFGRRPSRRSDGDDVHWCSAFVNFCLHTTGYSHTGNAYARSFLRTRLWRFDPVPDPRPGAIIVVGPPKGKHVGFLHEAGRLPHNPGGNVRPGRYGGSFKMLGGNQSDTVTISNERRVMLAFTRGSVTSPYLWPQVGTPNCNADLPTAQPHFCGNRFETPAVDP